MTARERIRAVVEKWFLVEPLLFAVWTTHALVINPHIRTIRVGHGRIQYHPQFIEALTRQQLEEVLTCEAMRIVLKHPYIRRREPAILAYAASNLTLQEVPADEPAVAPRPRCVRSQRVRQAVL